MYIGLHVKYLFFLSHFHKTSLFFTVYEKYSNIKFHENPSSGSKVVPCRQMDGLTDGQTDMTKSIVSFRIFVNVPTKQSGPVTILAESQTGDVFGPTRLF
jgi:hypothetical protein